MIGRRPPGGALNQVRFIFWFMSLLLVYLEKIVFEFSDRGPQKDALPSSPQGTQQVKRRDVKTPIILSEPNVRVYTDNKLLSGMKRLPCLENSLQVTASRHRPHGGALAQL